MGGWIVLCMLIIVALILCGYTDMSISRTIEKNGSTILHTAATDTGTNQADDNRRGEKTGEEREMTGMQTGTHKTIPLRGKTTIHLKENPSTGYMWNVTVSTGLVVENDTYVADPFEPGLVGSGGIHYWLIRGTERGNQVFSAIYKRPWEPETENNTRFFMNITVT